MIARDLFISGLRELAGFLDDNPQIPVPVTQDFYVFTDVDAARDMMAGTGTWDKDYNGEYLSYIREFGGMDYRITVARDQVCERVQVGVRHVDAQPERDEPVYEWKCS
jgi:hypothetical protein